MAIPSGLTSAEYFALVKNNIIRPRYKFEFLNDDLTTKFEVIEDLVDNSGSINNIFNGEVGVRRTCSIKLNNIDKRYLPNPNTGTIWFGSQFKLSLGLEDDSGNTYWSPNGVYVISSPESSNTSSQKDLQIQGIDKWSLLNGQISGEITETYEIPLGTNVYDAISAILAIDRGNGYPYDSIEPKFDQSNSTAVTSYTIREEQGGNYGNLINKLCENIQSYGFYDEYGRLNIVSGTRDLSDNQKGSIYDFNDSEIELIANSISYNFENVKNSIRVVGMNINGNIATGLAENTNPASSTRINLIGKRSQVIKVDTISSDSLALDYANLLLKTATMLNVSLNINCTFMTHLDVNSVITLTSDYYGYDRVRFLIQSINIPLAINSQIAIKATNVNDLPFSQ